MKRVVIISFLLLIFISINVYATSGTIKQGSVIECNNKYYGHHGNPTHWHIVEKKDGKWVSISREVDIPPCYIKPVNEKEKAKFSKCIDGDTAKFIINNEEKTVRFLAIDTPETKNSEKKEEPFGEEASKYTCNALKKAKSIYLEYDGNSDREDKYGRILAFVYVDDKLLEKELIENGLAKVAYIYGDYEYVDDLRKTEDEAKKNKIGIWSEKEYLPDVREDNIYQEIWNLIKVIIDALKKIFALIFN